MIPMVERVMSIGCTTCMIVTTNSKNAHMLPNSTMDDVIFSWQDSSSCFLTALLYIKPAMDNSMHPITSYETKQKDAFDLSGKVEISSSLNVYPMSSVWSISAVTCP